MLRSRLPLLARLRGGVAVIALVSLAAGGGATTALAQPKPTNTTKLPSAKPVPAPKGSAATSANAATDAAPEMIEGSDDVQRLYMVGDEAFKRLAFTEAEVAFTKAWALSKSFDVAGKLGETKLEMGKYREAASYMSFALRNALPSTRAKHRERLKNALDRARQKLATVKLSSNVAEAKLLVDGAGIDPIFLGPEVYVDPGTRTFEATADGYAPGKQAVEMKAGEIYVVTLMLEALGKEPVIAPPAEQSTPWPAAVLGAAGAAALLGGAVLIGVAESRKGDAYALARNTLTADGDPTCPKKGPGPTDQCDKVRSAAGDTDAFGNAGIGVLIGGGVLIGAAALYVLWPRAATPAAPPSKAGRIFPVAGPTGGGLVWRGSF